MNEITDSTIARIAGNLLSKTDDWRENVHRQAVVDAAVETAEAIAETVVKRRRKRDKDEAIAKNKK